MPLAGTQLSYGWALALCYHVGWHGKDLNTAVALMCAESARYTEAWHENVVEGKVTSTDWGLYQINDRWHPDFELPYGLNPIANAQYAHGMWKASKGFSPWMAYVNAAHLKFLPVVWFHRVLGRWKTKVSSVEKKWA